ncbi:MAG: tRNA (cytidine(34)-2'-O)-methyltransferase [Gammaproteobacteria bacterium]|nr:tRNA (cytidine(34)-2'-O)-methyltransferase [Gammaproteobacteria bacterium]MBU1645891.1 tRNA (cytidine(34)-2'-O)-methyltransferase [Gammaproteobacteria bacterium]MBU1971953.1 tRNA (cytidine(34)-2'-O)-methyltransferase [Gammaproteobacteria bacterium]
MFDIVLYQPEIPPNTGNVVRLSANAGCRLHLVGPLGFDLSEKQLKRAGMDYAEFADVRIHADWAACRAALPDRRWFALTTKGNHRPASADFLPGDVLVFGPESRGLPPEILAEFADAARLRLPMMPGCRSVNLSNAVAVVVYEAWRQQGYAGGQ